MPDRIVQRLAVRKILAGLNGVIKLRRITSNSLELCLEFVRDVHDEGGLHVILTIRETVNELPGTMCRNLRFNFLQPRNEACIPDELSAHGIIVMTAAQR